MKKLGYIFGIFCMLALLHSCLNEPKFDKSLLSGKWQQGTLFEKYFSDGTGYTWDEGDDVKEHEAQKFEWTLDDVNLTQIHLGEMGQKVPKSYKVTELTKTSFK